jgi:hypothetical protein
MTESRTCRTDAVTLLRSAASESLPVVVEMGPEQVRSGSFIGAVHDEAGGYAVLEPVVEALPEVIDHPFKITAAAGPGWLVIAHRLERAGRHRARIALARARGFEVEAPAASAAIATISAPERAHGLVTDADEVRRVLQAAGALRCEGWFEAPGSGRGRLRFEVVGADHVRLAVSSPARVGLRSQSHVRIGVEVFAVAYELDVLVQNFRDARIVTSLPLILRRRCRPLSDQRVQVSPLQQVDLSFRNPATGAVHEHPVTDLSRFDVTFGCSPSGAALWPGLALAQAQLTWRERLIHLGDLAVEGHRYDQRCAAVRCTAAILRTRIGGDGDLIDLIATLTYAGTTSLSTNH